ncbi:partial uroporphyrin-III C-methyltransferase / precorrin-2 dehydrogenase / sirohydrochlorin ferrochelatase, partial [biofilm metagenome]
MDYFPLFFNIKDQDCLIVGGGEIAARKIDLLARAGAKITVIAKAFTPTVIAMHSSFGLILKEQEFSFNDDLSHFKLIVSATDDQAINESVAKRARQLGIPVNVVDNPDLSSFIFPAIVDRSPLIIAVSSGGAAPVLARLLRAKIESVIPPAYGKLAILAQQFRARVKERLDSVVQRRIFWENVFQGNVAEQVFSGHEDKAEALLKQWLRDIKNINNTGEVYLIGAGPGAADLLTFRALRLLQQADIVVYDRLVSPEILDLARRDADKIYVGKQRQNHALP